MYSINYSFQLLTNKSEELNETLTAEESINIYTKLTTQLLCVLGGVLLLYYYTISMCIYVLEWMQRHDNDENRPS